MRPSFALVLLVLLAACGTDRTPEPPPQEPDYVNLDVGLEADERRELRHLSEGSDLFPVHLLMALEDSFAGRPFVETLPRFGFLPSEKSEENPYGLPVGWTVDTPEISPNRLPYVGVNCAACHTGQIEYQGHRLRIDGAPNLVDLEAFGQAVRDSLVATLTDREKTFDLIVNLARALHPEAGDAAVLLLPRDTRRFLENLRASAEAETDSAEGAPESRAELVDDLTSAVQRLLEDRGAGVAAEIDRLEDQGVSAEAREHVENVLRLFERFGPIVKNRLGFALRAIAAIDASPPAGPGRDDPWGVIRNLVFETPAILRAPTSIPHLFGSTGFQWYHADGNTTSVLQRNVAQAVALGAYVDLANGESTLRPRQLHRLEELWAKVEAPAWPEEILGEIDRDRARRGEEIFARKMPGPRGGHFSCADCHSSSESRLFDLELIGTDPNRAVDFARPLDGRPFDQEIVSRVGAVIAVALERAGIDPDEAASWEYRAPEWRTTGGYVARRLDGVWATAPYLHNGSVPTLWDLLLPAAQRPATFPLGHRELDTERVGYTTSVLLPTFLFDTAVDGNSNAGHEFGTQLDDDERRDLIEYLKSM